MPDSMIERVARAICVGHGYDPDSDDEVGTGDPGTVNWNCFEDDARAAITAMREPTAAMVASAATAAGVRELDRLIGIAHSMGQDINPASLAAGSPIAQAWSAMIDAALESQAS